MTWLIKKKCRLIFRVKEIKNLQTLSLSQKDALKKKNQLVVVFTTLSIVRYTASKESSVSVGFGKFRVQATFNLVGSERFCTIGNANKFCRYSFDLFILHRMEVI